MRKTKDVICRKCGAKTRIPVNTPLAGKDIVACCTRRQKDGVRCLGSFKKA